MLRAFILGVSVSVCVSVMAFSAKAAMGWESFDKLLIQIEIQCLPILSSENQSAADLLLYRECEKRVMSPTGADEFGSNFFEMGEDESPSLENFPSILDSLYERGPQLFN